MTKKEIVILVIILTTIIGIVVLNIFQIKSASQELTKTIDRIDAELKLGNYDPAILLCDDVEFRKGICYKTIYGVLLTKQRQGEEVPLTNEFCNKFTAETTNPMWHFVLTIFSNDNYNADMIQTSKDCLSNIS